MILRESEYRESYPFRRDICFPAPDTWFRDEQEREKQEREKYVQAKMREVRKAMNQHLTGRQKECLALHSHQG